MARERVVKYPPKRGILKRSEVKRAVKKVVLGRHGDKETKRTHSATIIRARRDAKTGWFISCKQTEHRKKTAVVETIKRPKKKK